MKKLTYIEELKNLEARLISRIAENTKRMAYYESHYSPSTRNLVSAIKVDNRESEARLETVKVEIAKLKSVK